MFGDHLWLKQVFQALLDKVHRAENLIRIAKEQANGVFFLLNTCRPCKHAPMLWEES